MEDLLIGYKLFHGIYRLSARMAFVALEGGREIYSKREEEVQDKKDKKVGIRGRTKPNIYIYRGRFN